MSEALRAKGLGRTKGAAAGGKGAGRSSSAATAALLNDVPLGFKKSAEHFQLATPTRADSPPDPAAGSPNSRSGRKWKNGTCAGGLGGEDEGGAVRDLGQEFEDLDVTSSREGMEIDGTGPPPPAGGTCPGVHDRVGRGLGKAQEELRRLVGHRLQTVPGDGSCFFHVLRRALGGVASVETLRRRARCPGDTWAEAAHALNIGQAMGIQFFFWQVEINGPAIVIPLVPFTIGDNTSHRPVHMLYWTRNGNGLHFDCWSPPPCAAGGASGSSTEAGSASTRACEVSGPPQGGGR